ncbi:MAG: YqgE/AlgH family protein [Pseudohongiellaceae bacterium]
MTDQENLTNFFLIAMPQLEDSCFARSVVYMWRHSHEGALGLVVNNPLDMELSEVFEQLDLEDQRRAPTNQTVLFGGPVEKDKGFIIHDSPKKWNSTLEVTDEIRITTSRDILDDISCNKGPDNFLIVLGCAGWGPGQLEQEIVENSWLTCPASKEILFSTDFARKVDMAASTMGFDMSRLTPDIGYS